jgi:predicted ATPase
MLNSLRISGWKSIREASIEISQLNIIIGGNGAGKSNLISFFKLLNEMIGERLQTFVGLSGGANSVLYFGSKTTPVIEADVGFSTDAGRNAYGLRLAHAAGDTLIYTNESILIHRPNFPQPFEHSLGAGHRETRLNLAAGDGDQTARVIRRLIAQCRVFHFHDTSNTSRIRQHGYVDNDRFLFPDGGNLAAVLYRYQKTEETAYHRIVQTIRQIAPFFDNFELEPSRLNDQSIILNWRAEGWEYPFGPHQLSDGTLRAMALVTLLLQPQDDLPAIIVIDEPELGLHPYAIGVLAGLLKQVSTRCQILASTQSALLVDHFKPEDVIVADRDIVASTFRRLDSEQLGQWLEEYSLGELWEKNVYGGGPH